MHSKYVTDCQWCKIASENDGRMKLKCTGEKLIFWTKNLTTRIIINNNYIATDGSIN